MSCLGFYVVSSILMLSMSCAQQQLALSASYLKTCVLHLLGVACQAYVCTGFAHSMHATRGSFQVLLIIYHGGHACLLPPATYVCMLPVYGSQWQLAVHFA
jgi:hypothetical protein